MCAPEGCWRKHSAALRDAALDDVVAQNHADLLAVGEVLGQRQGVGDAAFALLVGVVDMVQPELLAVGQQAQKIARIAAAGDDQDIANAGIHEGLDGVIDHRPVVNGQQVFVGDLGEREQPAAGSPGEYDTLHRQFSSYRMGGHPASVAMHGHGRT